MANFNRVILVGNLTRQPELKYTPGGQTAVTEIGMAINDYRRTASGEQKKEVVFVDVTLWGRTAEVVCQHLSKGSPILVEGRLKYDTWESEGQKRSKLRVVGEKVQFLGGRGGGDNPNYNEDEAGEPAQNYGDAESKGSPNESGDEHIPF